MRRHGFVKQPDLLTQKVEAAGWRQTVGLGLAEVDREAHGRRRGGIGGEDADAPGLDPTGKRWRARGHRHTVAQGDPGAIVGDEARAESHERQCE